MPEKAVRKSENWRNPHQSSIGRAAGWKIVNSKIVTARQVNMPKVTRRRAKSDPPTVDVDVPKVTRRRAKSDPSTCQK